ncbi:hypothetical protein MFU01_05510 [Myxococcus fulvus]|uniref:Uncharacterized protein n=1 Tax=Myxococcus fulvus TaxID=33 RepID=A0A511SUB8_MYXFU|nr:hypothetical protein MFU01_05510 [Myxococcus fulvus]
MRGVGVGWGREEVGSRQDVRERGERFWMAMDMSASGDRRVGACCATCGGIEQELCQELDLWGARYAPWEIRGLGCSCAVVCEPGAMTTGIT